MDLANITQDNVATACYRKNGYFLEEYNCPTGSARNVGDRDIGLWRQFTKQVERLYE